MKLYLPWLMRRKDRRRTPRRCVKHVVAVYWDGLPDSSHAIKDMNLEGAYISTAVSWAQGTLIQLTLKIIAGGDIPNGGHTFSGLWANVVRSTADGFCVEFFFSYRGQRAELRQFLRHVYEE